MNTDIYKLLLKNGVHVTSVTLLTFSKQTTTLNPIRETDSHRQGQSRVSPTITPEKWHVV